MTAFILGTTLAMAAAAQAERPSVQDVLKEIGPTIRAIEGVVEVSAGGTAEEPRIMVRVASEEAKATVRQKIGASASGYKFFLYMAPTSGAGQTVVTPTPPPAEPPKTPPRKTDAEKPAETPNSLEDCDILRDYLKLKPVIRHKDGKTIDGCQLMRRSRVGGGGGHAFWYTRHRFDCPIRT